MKSFIVFATSLLASFYFTVTPLYAQEWAFEETFDSDPSSPSQDLLPRTFDYVVTHRRDSGGILVDYSYGTFPADHGHDCTGPEPGIPLDQIQHPVKSSHLTNGTNNIDESFFICKNHMMSSIGDIAGYSVTSFYPKQEFDFSDGGMLEWDVNLTDGHSRNWYEVMIVPRDQLKVGAAIDWLPIDETYPRDRIVFQFGLLSGAAKREILIGKDQLSPNGVIASAGEFDTWGQTYPNDPAVNDRRIRRKNRITFSNNQITWGIQKLDGTFDEFSINIPLQNIPFKRGIVVFKSHAYTPNKDGVHRLHTFHWDNIRFDGPVVGKFEAYEANSHDVIQLQANGDVPIGTSQTVNITIPKLGSNPKITGQIESPSKGQVKLSINGRPDIVVEPIDYGNESCFANGWKSFSYDIDPAWLNAGNNTFKWTVGQRNCPASWTPQGFAVKSFQVEIDADGTSTQPTNTPIPTTFNPDIDNNDIVNIFDFNILVKNFSQFSITLFNKLLKAFN